MALNKREKSFCVLEYARTSSVVTVQRQFRAQFNKEPSVHNSIRKWYETIRNVELMHWPPRSPDLTPCYFYLWEFVKDTVFVSPVPGNLQELRDRITAAVLLIDRDMLTRVWNEWDYRSDV